MDEFLAKLTNLSYEFFGVILPGLVGGVLLIVWWVALGPLANKWTWGFVPQLTLDVAVKLTTALSSDLGVGLAFPALVGAYLVGHILLWLGRSGPTDQDAASKAGLRVRGCLRFRIPKPKDPFHPDLRPMFEVVRSRFTESAAPLEWRQFYPLAKCYLAKALPTSLVATYQNKYTLHRSIATAAAVWFWLNLGGLVGGAITYRVWGIAPHWGLLVTSWVFAMILLWGFSSSYIFHWENFGNSLVTETFTILLGPQDDRSSN